MATSTQQQSFVSKYYPLANQIAGETGDSSSEILSQWALETGWGTSMAGQNNLGNVMNNGSDLNYSTAAAGAAAYANVLKSEGVVNDAGNTSAFANQLDAGHYAGSQVGYGQSVTSLIPTVDTMEANQTSGSQPTFLNEIGQMVNNGDGDNIPAIDLTQLPNQTASKAVQSDVKNATAGCAFSLDDPVSYFVCEGANIILIIIGLVVVLFAIDAFIRSSMVGSGTTKVSNTYQTSKGIVQGTAKGYGKAKSLFAGAASDAADVAVVAA